VTTGFSGVIDPVHVWMCFVGTWEILVAAQGRVLSRKAKSRSSMGKQSGSRTRSYAYRDVGGRAMQEQLPSSEEAGEQRR